MFVQADWHEMGVVTVTETVVLKINPPLPCATLDGSETCDRLASHAYAYPTRGPRPGVWLIMPVCDQCADMGTVPDANDRQNVRDPSLAARR